MGGDWAICSILLTRKIRDVVRWNSMIQYKFDFKLVMKTFKNSTAERVQLGPINLQYISLASQSFLLPC